MKFELPTLYIFDGFLHDLAVDVCSIILRGLARPTGLASVTLDFNRLKNDLVLRLQSVHLR